MFRRRKRCLSAASACTCNGSAFRIGQIVAENGRRYWAFWYENSGYAQADKPEDEKTDSTQAGTFR
jgi:hypothetical protein